MSDIELEVSKLDVAAGDVVVVRLAHKVPPEVMVEQVRRLEAVLPEGVRAIVVDEDVDVSTLVCTCASRKWGDPLCPRADPRLVDSMPPGYGGLPSQP